MFYSFGDLSHRRGAAGGFYRFPAQDTQNVPEFYPDGFLPLIQPTMDDQSITIGIRRKGDWNVDASLTHGASAFRFDIDNTVNASLGTASPTTFDAGTLASTETVANLDLLHKLDTDAVKSLALVLGSELRVENYHIHAGDHASYELGTATTARRRTRSCPARRCSPASSRATRSIARATTSASTPASSPSSTRPSRSTSAAGSRTTPTSASR